MATASSSMGRTQNFLHENTRLPSELPSSSTSPKKAFDAFINHYGDDVKLKLASPLYHFFDGSGVNVFLDINELDLGLCFAEGIEDALRSALIHIAIFSPNYARSAYCLQELSFMLETGTTIIPVFYDVNPGDLRWKATTGSYALAFSDHETKKRYEPETIQKWKDALHRVSFNEGPISTSDSDQGLLLKTIKDRVIREIRNVKVPLHVATYPTGMDDAVQEFEAVRSEQDDRNVGIVRIVGMGGCGKTTFAKELYNRKYKEYDYSSFLFRVREIHLHELQKQLLDDVLHLNDISFKDASQGKSVLDGRLKYLDVLIVLDDVNNVSQLNALLPQDEKGNITLGSGSLIIVTTRDSTVLGSCSVYKMRALDPSQARDLFCRHAFGKPSPPAAFEGLVQGFINACDALPLYLEVTAGSLYGKTQRQWESALEKVSGSLPGKIEECLRLSYDALDDEEKNIFLDVACFFVGEKKSLANAVWHEAGWSDLDNLVSKCLVNIDKQNRIRMHTNLRDLGKKIALDRAPYRLCSSRQMAAIITYREKEIRGIMAATTEFAPCDAHNDFPKCLDRYSPRFEDCKDFHYWILIKLLVVAGNHFPADFSTEAKQLVWLRWFDFQHAKLPAWLSLTNLRVLELYGTSSLQQLWENSAQPPEELREMVITATEGNIFYSFPSQISGLKHLTKIALISYNGKEFRFSSLPDEFCDLHSLEHLELRQCKKLSSLPAKFGKLRNLRYLDLWFCKRLRNLPDSFQRLRHLKHLDLSECNKLVLKEDCLQKITQLENLYLSGCRAIQKLPNGITNQACLRELRLQDTSLEKLPTNIGRLTKLEVLTIGSQLLKRLPASLGDLSSLTSLSIIHCNEFKSLPKTLKKLKLLEDLCIEATEIKKLPKGFKRLANLRTLKISSCPLAELDFGSVPLEKLAVIRLEVTNVKRISITKNCCPSLETLHLSGNDNLEEIEVPETVHLDVSDCEKLKKKYSCSLNRSKIRRI